MGATQKTVRFLAQIETNGSATEYKFEYMPVNGDEWKEFSVGGSGTISTTEEYLYHEAEATGLEPETDYRARITMKNTEGTTIQSTFFGAPPAASDSVEIFYTRTARPEADSPVILNPKATTVRLFAGLRPNGSETSWRFETGPSATGPWTPVTGADGKVEALPEGTNFEVEADAGGLQPATKYFARLSATNSYGESLLEPPEASVPAVSEFETAGPPAVSTDQVHALDTDGVRLLANANPRSVLTAEEQTITLEGASTSGSFTLAFEGQTTHSFPYDATANEVSNGLSELPQLHGRTTVFGNPGGPYTVVWIGEDASVNVPQLAATGSGLTVNVATRQEGGEGYEAKIGFEYVTQAQYEASGFAEAERTVEQPLAEHIQPITEVVEVDHVGVDVPDLQAGEQYRYRAVATSTFPGGEHVVGETVAVNVPALGSSGKVACPNDPARTGFAAGLPDCRAYEQVTPLDKEGAQEAFNYGPAVEAGAIVGEEGEHLTFESAAVDWGTASTSGQSPYLFSRESGGAWGMLAGSQQPETGVQRIVPELVSDDATQVAYEADVHTSLGSGESKEVSFMTGPIGGPYATAAVVPRSDLHGHQGDDEGWMAASANFRTLILQLEDHTLLGSSTRTRSGNDLYEYSDGELRQVNVGLGTCGAHIVTGGESYGVRSSSHAVSADGSRVFFEAVPGGECSATPHLYVRKTGSETIDLGAYRFDGANPAGTQLLLRREEGGMVRYYIDELEAGTPVEIYSTRAGGSSNEAVVSEDFGAIYFQKIDGELFRYDVASKQLTYLFQVSEVPGSDGVLLGRTTPDGRVYYVEGDIAGVPGEGQVFLYDSDENSVDCVSCASSFDPQPKLDASFPHAISTLGLPVSTDGRPEPRFVSADGRYAFFDTPSALLPEDVDQEITPTFEAGSELQSQEYSPSSDVYEWRADGVDGCSQIQGCLALITNGRGGYLNLVLGTDRSGANVFVYTRSQLLAQDKDNAGDIYDVRVDGGLPESPARTVECEADACVKPAPAPNDATPASATYDGPGNPTSAATGGGKAKPKVKSKAKKKKKKPKRKKRKRRASGARKPAHKAARRGARSRTRKGNGR